MFLSVCASINPGFPRGLTGVPQDVQDSVSGGPQLSVLSLPLSFSHLAEFQIFILGVFVQASTLGSLEALLEFLKTSKIPYAGVRIGPVVRKDVMRASTMLEHEEKYAVILAFDVKAGPNIVLLS